MLILLACHCDECYTGDGQSTATGADVYHDDNASSAVHAMWSPSQAQSEGAQQPAAGRLRHHDHCRPLFCQDWHAARYTAFVALFLLQTAIVQVMCRRSMLL